MAAMDAFYERGVSRNPRNVSGIFNKRWKMGHSVRSEESYATATDSQPLHPIFSSKLDQITPAGG